MNPLILFVLACCVEPESLPQDPQPACNHPGAEARSSWQQEAERLRWFNLTRESREDAIIAAISHRFDRPDVAPDDWSLAWCGIYTGRVSFYLSPDKVLYSGVGSCFPPFDANEGEVLGTFDVDDDGNPDGIRVQWGPRYERGDGYDTDRLFFVTWAIEGTDRVDRFLVPESAMLEWVNNLNRGVNKRGGVWTAPRMLPPSPRYAEPRGFPEHSGMPELPAPWAGMILTHPLDATVTSLREVQTREYMPGSFCCEQHVTIDKGASDGVYPGLELWLREDLTSGFCVVEFDVVHDRSAEGTARAFADDAESAPLLEVGKVLQLAEGFEKLDDG